MNNNLRNQIFIQIQIELSLTQNFSEALEGTLKIMEEKIMKKIIVVRHGIYDDITGELIPIGKNQLKKLAKKIFSIVEKNSRVIILASNALRCQESADIISKKIGIEFESHKILFSDCTSLFEDFEIALKLVQSKMKETDLLILVTHSENCIAFPRYFSKEFNIKISSSDDDKYFPGKKIPEGQACLINYEEKTFSLI